MIRKFVKWLLRVLPRGIRRSIVDPLLRVYFRSKKAIQYSPRYCRYRKKRFLKNFPLTHGELKLGDKATIDMSFLHDPELFLMMDEEFCDVLAPYVQRYVNPALQFDYNEGPYEYGKVLLEKGDVVFDCGANLGYFSVVTQTMNCTCYAFEPVKMNLQYLHKNATLNSDIIVVPYAVGDHVGDVQIYTVDSANSSATLVEESTGAMLIHTQEGQTAITIPCTTIDQFVEENNLERVDFIKADIEGAERIMLKGAKETLRRFAPKLSLCTYHLPDDPQVMRELIHDANPDYVIEEAHKKMYAYVPNRVVSDRRATGNVD